MTVADYLEKPKGLHDMYDAMDLDDFLLAALKVSLAGMYSNWHDTAVYEYGYEHDEAWRLAYMCAYMVVLSFGTHPSLHLQGFRMYWTVSSQGKLSSPTYSKTIVCCTTTVCAVC